MAIILFDTDASQSLYPLTFTRAVAGLRIGIFTIKERWELLLNEEILIETAAYLQPLYKAIPEGIHTFIDAAVLPTKVLVEKIKQLQQGEVLEDENGIIACKAYSNFFQHAIDDAATLFTCVDVVQRLQYPHQIFQWNKDFIAFDYELITKGRTSAVPSSSNKIINTENVFIEENVHVEFTIINATDGPVYIGKNATVMEGCFIRGPFALCEGATLKMGAKIYGATTIGPHCVAGGEIKNTVMFGNSNKAHDGYLGDSVIGEWCNFGAGSSNSNVKNTAGDILIWNEGGQSYINTGNKCGLIMGDYSRIAINSSINTGSVYGVCCNIFGAGLLPKKAANFTWGSGDEKYNLHKAFLHVKQWKKMKGQIFTDEEKAILQHIFERT